MYFWTLRRPLKDKLFPRMQWTLGSYSLFSILWNGPLPLLSSRFVQLLIPQVWAYMLFAESPKVKNRPPSKIALHYPHMLMFLSLWSLSPWTWAGPDDHWNDISSVRLHKDSGFCLACAFLLAHSHYVMSCPLYGKKLRGFWPTFRK